MSLRDWVDLVAAGIVVMWLSTIVYCVIVMWAEVRRGSNR